MNEDSFIERLRNIFVSREVFDLSISQIISRIIPLEKIGYGVIAMIVIAVVGAWIALVVNVKKIP